MNGRASAWPLAGALTRLVAATVLASTPALGLHAQSSDPTVTPQGDSISVLPNSSSLTKYFTVYNNDDFTEKFILTCGASGAISGCTRPSSVSIPAWSAALVKVGFTSGSVGSGQLTLTASDVGGSDQGWYAVTVAPPPVAGVQITPFGFPLTVPANTTGLTYAFTVTNSGTASGTIALSTAACTSPATGCSAPSPASVTLAPQQSAPVTITYATTSSPGANGSIQLHGSVGSSQSDGLVSIATYLDAALQNPATVGPGIERGLCLTFALSAGAASECGDLRLVHALPEVQSLGEARAPTLVYNSQHAHPFPLVSAVATAPTGQALPTSVIATLLVNGVARDSGTWAGSQWGAAGNARKITLGYDALTDSTGLYPYSLQIVGVTGGVRTTWATITGQLIVVNRAQSPFGAGWWLAGLDQLIPESGNSFLFVGGDGSTRVYTPVAGSSTLWSAPQLTRRDLLELVGTEYVQRLPDGLSVHFNTAGRHVSTINRLGHTTTFTYDATCAQLSTITTPMGGLAYSFTYTTFGTPPCGNRRLSSVTAPPVNGMTRVVTLGAQASGDVQRITDPDSSVITLGYDPARSHRVITRTDALGKLVTFAFDAGSKVSAVTESMDAPTPAIITHYTASESRGLPGSTAVDTAQDYTLVNGPRTDTTITRFWLDRFGAPRKIVNAIGQVATLTRGDARWPALVTRMVAPNGLVSTAGYDAFGHVVADTLFNPLGDGQNAVSSYAWDLKYDRATRITTPTGQVTTHQYNGATGNRLWSEFGGDTTRFAYNMSTGLLSEVSTSDGAADFYTYDAALANLATHTPPLGAATVIARDAIGRDTLAVTPVAVGDTLHVRTRYDRMGRDTLTVSWGRRDSLTVRQQYDAEGELLAVTQHAYPDTNHLGDVTRSFGYDAMGRKITESLAGQVIVRWTYDPAGNLLTGGRTALQGATLRYDALNRLVARSGAVHDTLTYDAAGNLATATNPWARTARTYYPNGLVKTDTQQIATTDTTTTDFSKHVYVLGYSYDVGGRRTALTLPTQLGAGQTTYGYDPRTGQLALVTDRLGLHFRSHYDAMDRLDSLLRRDGLSDPVTETRTYDLASRLLSRVVKTAAGAVLEGDTLSYNLVGKVVGTSMGDAVSYHPLGYITESTFDAKTEYSTLDAMANRVTAHTQIVHGFQDRVEQYTPGTMKLRAEWDPVMSAPDADTTRYDVDALGAVYHSLRQLTMGPWTDPSTHLQYPALTLSWDIVNAYDDANRMIRHQLSYDSLPNPRGHLPYMATETYRYDALGRRVWVRSVKDSLCYYAERSSGCHNTLTRTIWDGAQILGEIRADGKATATPAALENDNPTVGANYGVVLYTYGGGALDEPWSVIKGASDEVLPVTNWRGMIDRGSCPATPCVGLVFPQSNAGLYGGPALADGPPSWYGTILDGQQDASGYIYRRNRYLDPATGRFTQEDPLGLAGGLNLYGFGGGDPVSYSDPFGLCPDPNDPKCTEGTKVFSLTAGAFFGLGKGTITDHGLGWNFNGGIAVDNKWNVMAFGTAGLSLSAGTGAKWQFSGTKGSLNDLVSKTGKGGGYNVTGVVYDASGSVQYSDAGKPVGVGIGGGAGGGLSLNTTEAAKGYAVNLPSVWSQLKKDAAEVDFQWNFIMRQASQTMTGVP